MSDPRSPRVRSAEETILDLHAKIESDAKVIAALREALEMIAGRRQSGMAANDRLVHEFSMENPMSDIPHTPWFIRARPTDDGQAVIDNGTSEGSRIAVAEWHIAEFIVKTVNLAHQQPD